jgi:hypothetical protein
MSVREPMPDSTLIGFETRRQERTAAWGRRAVLGVLALIVFAGLIGVLGVRTTTGHASGGGFSLSVDHASVARAGLDVPWQVTVTNADGFEKTVTLAVTGDYFDMYETQGFTPEPSASVRDGETLYLTFDAPKGDTFTVDYDAYIQPSSQRGESGTVSVVDSDLRPLASVDIDTFLLP